MAQVLTGLTRYVATSLAAEKTISAATNASECVVTSTAHGFSNGDFVLITDSGWSRMHKRAFRIATVATDTFHLEGFDTSDTKLFPSGGGIGSCKKVSGWTQVPSTMNTQVSGGDPKSVTYQFEDSEIEFSLNTGFSAASETFDIDADEVGGTAYDLLQAYTDVQTDTVMKKVMKSGSIILMPCKIALNPNPTGSANSIMVNRVSVNGTNRVTRYES